MTEPVALARKVVQNPNLIVFINEIVEATAQGWKLDEQNPPNLYGYFYETHLLMPENEVPEVKPSRAEILGNARAAKKAKAQADASEPEDKAEPAA